MKWEGFQLTHGRKKAKISRSHGGWIALVYFINGAPKAGEYFSYSEPGAIDRAKRWCEAKIR